MPRILVVEDSNVLQMYYAQIFAKIPSYQVTFAKNGRQALEAAGATEVFTSYPIAYGGWHLLGTARMGTDPARSVVNGWGRSHDVKNLFIVDGSIFVTGGGVNPASTIQACALYIADTMKKNLANLFD